MKILLTGGNGQVGWELRRALAPLGEVIAPGRAALDLTDADALRRAVRDSGAEAIVNAAAYTAVDRAENEAALAEAVNACAPAALAEAARDAGALLLHYSTDYVFDGRADRPYAEDAPTGPLNVYGATKLAGERAVQAAGGAHLILRTSWVYGARGHNFLRTIARLAAERDELKIVADQIGAPTWSRLIAEASAQILVSRRAGRGGDGVYHLSCGGRTSWHGFASAIVAGLGGRRPRLLPIATGEYPLPAARPRFSLLDNARLERDYGLRLPDWQHALELCLEDIRLDR